MPDLGGYVLVGGKSSRFGRDKALVEVGGQVLAVRMAGVLQPLTKTVTLVGPPEKYRHLGLRVISDPLPDYGPLAGLLAALDDSASSWNIITACDLPNISTGFLEFLVERARNADADIVVPVDAAGNAEPLCAAYALHCRESIRRAIEWEVHKVTEAFTELRVLEVKPEEYAAFNPDGRLFANLNSVEDLTSVAGKGS